MSDADLLGSPAGTDGAPDVVYRIIDSPVGPLLLAATDSGLVLASWYRAGTSSILGGDQDQAAGDRVMG